jgi:predicted ester cyclase
MSDDSGDSKTSSETTNLDRLTQYFEEVWNLRLEESIDKYMWPDVRAHGIQDEPLDREGFKVAWRAFLETFPDMKVLLDDVTGNEDTTAARLTIVGTHLGNGLGIPATGRPVKFGAQTFCRWRDGRVIEGWNVIDMASVYRQTSGT